MYRATGHANSQPLNFSQDFLAGLRLDFVKLGAPKMIDTNCAYVWHRLASPSVAWIFLHGLDQQNCVFFSTATKLKIQTTTNRYYTLVKMAIYSGFTH